jgi:hypothetical protein
MVGIAVASIDWNGTTAPSPGRQDADGGGWSPDRGQPGGPTTERAGAGFDHPRGQSPADIPGPGAFAAVADRRRARPGRASGRTTGVVS